MRSRFYLVTAAIILFSMYPPRLWGQVEKPKQPLEKEEPKEKPKPKKAAPKFGMPVLVPEAEKKLFWGSFETEGSVTVGYRFTSVKGDRSKYDNIYNLNDGFRLMDLYLTGRADKGSNLFADSYMVTLNSIGGDPFSGGQFTLRKEKVYDLRVNYRQSYYHWSQNNIDDQVKVGLGVPPELGGSPSSITAGTTANHSWATVRRLGSMNLNIRASNDLKFSFEYDRNTRNGMTQSTRNVYYSGNPNDRWGSSSRANPYVVAIPVDEAEDRFAGGIDYARLDWIIHYRVGYQTLSQNTSWQNLTSPQRSINTSTPDTAQELVTNLSWSEFWRLRTPISEFSYNGSVNNWLQLHGSYNYYHYTGPSAADAAFVGDVRTRTGPDPFEAYAASLNNRGRVDQPIHDVTQGLTAKIRKWWNFHADYRYYRQTSEGHNEYESNYNGIATAPTEEDEEWWAGTHWVDLNMEFLPASSLVIRGGIRYVKRDVKHWSDGEENDTSLRDTLNGSTLRTKNFSPVISVFYQPVKMFTIRGDFQRKTTTNPYTRISIDTGTGSRFVFRLKPSEKFSIEDNLVIRNNTYEESDHRSRYRSNAINVFYNPFYGNWLIISAGFSYESIFSKTSHFSDSGSTPFDGYGQDAFINRGWRGGLIIKPTKRFGIDLSGNFLRTTGASQLYSTVPAPGLDNLPIVWPVNFGPLTFPLVTGTFYYDFPKFGRLSVDLQRSYYAEEIVSGNNFQANFLAIRWTKNIGDVGD